MLMAGTIDSYAHLLRGNSVTQVIDNFLGVVNDELLVVKQDGQRNQKCLHCETVYVH